MDTTLPTSHLAHFFETVVWIHVPGLIVFEMTKQSQPMHLTLQ